MRFGKLMLVATALLGAASGQSFANGLADGAGIHAAVSQSQDADEYTLVGHETASLSAETTVEPGESGGSENTVLSVFSGVFKPDFDASFDAIKVTSISSWGGSEIDSKGEIKPDGVSATSSSAYVTNGSDKNPSTTVEYGGTVSFDRSSIKAQATIRIWVKIEYDTYKRVKAPDGGDSTTSASATSSSEAPTTSEETSSSGTSSQPATATISGQRKIDSSFDLPDGLGVNAPVIWDAKFSSGSQNFVGMEWSSTQTQVQGHYTMVNSLNYLAAEGEKVLAWNTTSGWAPYQTVDFGKTAQEVSLDMAAWFKANGTQVAAETAGKTELKSGANQDFYVLAGSSMTVDKILSGVSAVDLFGGQATVTVPDADKAAVDFNKAGSYVLHLTATDVYGQTATATITVHVIVPDSAAPVISRVDGKDAAKASIGLSAFKAKDFAAAKAEFLGQYQAVDAVDGKVALDATGFPASLDDLKGKAGKAVQVTLTATDKAGNKATQEVELTLVADALPVFYVDSWLVATTPDQPLTPDDVKALVYAKSAAADGADIHDIEIDAGDYLAHANEPGTYAVGFQYVTPDLTLAKGTVSVMVL